MVGAIHRFDADTTIKPSTGAAGGFYTQNQSWGLMAVEMARLQRDAWRLRGLISHIDVRYDFYGIGEEAGEAGLSVPLEQTIDFAYATGLRRMAPGLYLGPTALWMSTNVDLRNPSDQNVPTPPGDRGETHLVAPGLTGELDTRDDDYWPTSGSYARLKGTFFTDALGSSRTFQRYAGGWSWYGRMPAARLVLAANANAAAATGDVPFYALPSIGAGVSALRGYTQGRYRDHVMTTVQAELRYHLENPVGVAVFGGFGQVAPDGAGIWSAKALPAGGLGVRYQLTADYPLHMRIDYAWGRDEGLLYFSMGEAF
jgi:outer membrane protein assembly factor BamA